MARTYLGIGYPPASRRRFPRSGVRCKCLQSKGLCDGAGQGISADVAEQAIQILAPERLGAARAQNLHALANLIPKLRI